MFVIVEAMRKIFLGLLLALSPSFAFAAGFAPQSIFLSKSPVVEGDTVRIYAIVSNPSDAKFSGTVALSDAGNDIGAVAVTLAAGATQTASVLWKPLAGSHTISATLKADSGAVEQTKSETFTVDAPPPPPSKNTGGTQSAAAVESSAGIQSQLQSVSPQVAGVAAPVFNAIDAARQSIADITDQQLAATKPKVAATPLPGGQVEGAQTGPPSTGSWLWSIAYTIYFYILTLVRFLVGSAAVFYPVFAIAFLYMLWRMFRRFRRPAY